VPDVTPALLPGLQPAATGPAEQATAAALSLGALLLLTVASAVLSGVLQARAAGGRSPGFGGPVSDTARLLRQRRRVPVSADRLLWVVGTWGLLVAAVLMVAVVPWGGSAALQSDVGIVWFNLVDVAVWALVWLAGWGANAAYGIIGGHRFLAQALGYELPLMFALVAPAIAARSLDPAVVVGAQQGLWYAVWMPLAFLVFLVGVLGFSVSGPFAAALGPDVAGGVAAEVSGLDRLLLLAGRHALLAAGAAFAVPLFLGGGAGPLLPSWAWSVLKAAVVLAVLVWARRRLPLLRPDLFMEIGWLVLLPMALVQDLVVAVVAVWRG
jgi:NADH-quinone oxidoreductase subunit H